MSSSIADRKMAARGKLPPKLTTKDLRACKSCKMVKSLQQFIEQGCDNPGCDLGNDDRNAIMNNTTADFDG